MKKVLINRTDALGDTILSLPVAQALKVEFPDSQVAFLVKPLSAPLMENQPFVDKAICFQAGWEKECLAFNPDTFIHIHGDKTPLIWAFKRQIPLRLGVKSKWYSWLLLNRGQRQKRSLGLKHEAQYNLDLLQSLGMEEKSLQKENYPPKIYLSEIENEFARNYWSRFGEQEKVLIHPGMTGHTLNWSMQSYTELITKLNEKNFSVFLSYTSADQRAIDTIKSKLEFEVNEVNGEELGLRKYLAVLSQADLFIAPSTGPLHMAAALEVPCIGLYSPLRVQAVKRWGPLGGDGKVFTFSPEVTDEKLLNTIKRIGAMHPCMDQITVEQVLSQVVCVLRT